MSQNRKGSMVETLTNTGIGFAINWTANMIVLPLFGFHVSPAGAFHIGLVFTAISIARGYLLRRLFNHLKVFQC